MSAYISQSEDVCGGDRVDTACGPVSICNAGAILGLDLDITSALAVMKQVNPRLDGLSPADLAAVTTRLMPREDWVIEAHHPADVSDLQAGALLHVRSVPLLNAQGGNQYEEPDQDTHIVVVESVSETGCVTVINPDRRKCGKGFRHDIWGRMIIHPDHLPGVWQSKRADGSLTTRAMTLPRRRVP